MDRGRVPAAVALVLAVVVLATIAGGLSSSAAGDGQRSPGLGIGSGEGSGAGDSAGVGFDTGPGIESPFPPWLGLLPVLALLWLSLLSAVVVGVHYLWSTTIRQFLRDAVALLGRTVSIAVIVTAMIAVLLLIAGLFGQGGGGVLGGSAATGSQLAGDSPASPSPTLVTGVLVFAAITLLVLVLLVVLPADDDESTTVTAVEHAGGDEEADARPPLRADGDAENPAASNEVYRAWTELEDRVGRRDGAETPAELRRRALDAGLDEHAVEELTALFNGVRYGDRGVTSDRERRARDLRAALDGESERNRTQ